MNKKEQMRSTVWTIYKCPRADLVPYPSMQNSILLDCTLDFFLFTPAHTNSDSQLQSLM